MNAWLSFLALLPAVTTPVLRPVVTPPGAGGVTSRPGPSKPGGLHSRANGTFTLNVSPTTITFTGTNPAANPVVSGSASASVTWQNLDFNTGNWNLTVQAAGSSFTSCPLVPVSAVTVTCTAASAQIGGSANCASPFTLSTTAQPVASGTQNVITYNYSVTLTFTLSDSWKYIAETSPACSLSLSYLATVP